MLRFVGPRLPQHLSMTFCETGARCLCYHYIESVVFLGKCVNETIYVTIWMEGRLRRSTREYRHRIWLLAAELQGAGSAAANSAACDGWGRLLTTKAKVKGRDIDTDHAIGLYRRSSCTVRARSCTIQNSTGCRHDSRAELMMRNT